MSISSTGTTFSGYVSGISKTMVDLINVNNTSDLLKPISTATPLVTAAPQAARTITS